jgi:hypothetical protein
MRRAFSLFVAVLAPLTLIAATQKPNPDEMVNNPPFAHWSSFSPGTAVTQKETVSLPDGSKVEQTITAKLLDKSKDKLTVETTITEKGSGVVESEKTTTVYPAKVKMRNVDTPSAEVESLTEGKEEVDVKGKKVTAEWVEVTTRHGDEVTVEKIWTAQDVPGGLIKQTLTRKKGDKVLSESVRELVEVKPGS